jgi:hypothetical protein
MPRIEARNFFVIDNYLNAVASFFILFALEFVAAFFAEALAAGVFL